MDDIDDCGWERAASMPPNAGRTLFNVVAGLAVLLTSFWGTLKIMDYWAASADPDADLIVVTEATYGMSCQGSAPPGNWVKAGNVTAPIAINCTGTRKTCSFVVDVNRIGDPAPGCGKDLTINWRCGAQETVHRFHIAAEAHFQRALLACP